ncbi:Laminin subunit beta-4 [Liparis tanakae]|uniref:Laminin subunit beta-4 n=1 Tax=Liparis tanakae TaxID=230148 RepID=A0A4Z2FJY1_9TELE|nr:Laminin subunit beta-4 [Liparis tanakae]
MSVSACDCNVEGTERPSCDPETGECLCRVGVSGIFCDECAPGYDLAFPACSKCHPCNALWAGDVTDVQRAASRMRTFIPEVNKWPGDSRLQHMLKMHAELDSLGNLTGLSPPTPEKLEKLCAKIRKLHDAVDPNVILIDPSPLLNTEMDHIGLEFRKLLNTVKATRLPDPDDEDEDPDELLDETMKLHEAFMLDEKRVINANRAVEDSMDTRQEVKHKLNMCSSKGNMVSLEKVQELSLAHLNRMINDAKQQAQDTKDQAKDLQDRINNNIDSLSREKNKTNELIQQVKDYLTDEMVPPEDIEKMAQAVLDIQLPRSPDQIRSMINDINKLLSTTRNPPKTLEHTKTAQTLLQEAQKLKERAKNIDVTKISKDIYGAEMAQDKANDDLDSGSRDKDMAKDQIKDKLDEAMKLLELLKKKRSNQSAEDEAGERVRKMMEEAEKIKEQVEDKLLQLKGLEQKVQQLVQNKEDQVSEVSLLLQTVDSLRKEISKRAEGYVSCTA